MQTRLIPALLAALLASGCASTDPYTGEQKTSNATSGAIIGAVGGALIGAASSSKSDRGKGILIGAASGAAVGGGIGHYMDRQEAALREKLAGTGVSVKRDGDNIQLVMPNSLTFDVNSTQLKLPAINALSGVAMVVTEFDQTNLMITGHTDSTGGRDLNMRLSRERAESVASELVRHQVSVGRMSTHGYGPDRPIATNQTDAGRAENRRVEIFLTPRT
ncbi:OmpA family protein [Ferrimonas balearica]|uniref:OmpA family protein n=1 Tax=Ferrimonas balearica TaxID=44012 RepID=UPI001C99E1E4|nr:OmpA family protein [Ferrimonas balearica]MBY5992208.1 OmpA family protein [Ferrimonas balearica]